MMRLESVIISCLICKQYGFWSKCVTATLRQEDQDEQDEQDEQEDQDVWIVVSDTQTMLEVTKSDATKRVHDPHE